MGLQRFPVRLRCAAAAGGCPPEPAARLTSAPNGSSQQASARSDPRAVASQPIPPAQSATHGPPLWVAGSRAAARTAATGDGGTGQRARVSRRQAWALASAACSDPPANIRTNTVEPHVESCGIFPHYQFLQDDSPSTSFETAIDTPNALEECLFTAFAGNRHLQLHWLFSVVVRDLALKLVHALACFSNSNYLLNVISERL
jgi:hypothetical protein